MSATRADVEKASREIIAASYAGRAIEDAAVEWAVIALTAGIDTPNVRMLASLDHPANWFEVESYFRAALSEAGVPWLDREEALHAVARDTAADILSGGIDPQRGATRIARIAIDLDYPSDLMDFYVLEDDLCIQYGPDRVDPEVWEAEARRAAERLLSPSSQTAT